MITARRLTGFGVAIRAGHFEILSGMTAEKGGADEGPDPHELVEAALAACTIMTIQMYANHKKWPIDKIQVVIKIISETKENSIFSRDIALEGQLSDEQRQRLLEIANKCPIHRLLEGKVEIQSRLITTALP